MCKIVQIVFINCGRLTSNYLKNKENLKKDKMSCPKLA